MSILFEDFELTVDGKPDGYTVAVRGPGGISLEPVPFVLAYDNDFHSLLEELRDGERLELDELKEVGSALFDALFPRRVWRAYTGAVKRLPEGDVLRLKLNARVPELAQLPWELLYDEDEAAFLVRRRNRPLVRTLDTQVPIKRHQVRGPLRVLHVQANPIDLPPLDLAGSQEALKKRLGQRAKVISLVGATPDRLREALLDDYHILHYDGHAAFDEATERGMLFLHDEQDYATPLSAEMLADYLVGTKVRLVVLNACETGVENRRFGGLAQHLMRTSSMPALVAMQFAVEDGAAIAFNRGFYGSLAKGQPLEVAMVNGRLAMCEHSDSADWLAPMLFMRVEDGLLFPRHKIAPLARDAPFLAPPLPPYKLVGRDNILRDLKEQLFAGALAFSALNGLPGVGKTALAVALTHDPEVQAHFKDGVLWAGLGRTPDVLALLGNWALALGFTSDEIAKRTTIEERQRLLSTAIGRRQMLLVVDDAWKSEAALAFKVGGPNCAHLVTTRQPCIALDFAGKKGLTKVTELSLSDGLVLLETLAPQAVAEEPDIARQLVEAVGGLPLAIILMGRYLEKETYDDQPHRLSEALAELRDVEERLILEQPQESLERYPALPAGVPLSLLAVIEMSDKALDEVARRAFYALSVLPPKPNTFSVEAAQAVSQASTKALNKLIDYGLMESGGSGRYTLHQAIADYAKALLTDTNADERMVTFFVNYVEAHEREYDALEPEKNNVYAALDVAFERRMQTALVQGTNAFYHFMEVRGLYGLAETYLERAEQGARTLDDSIALVTTLLNLGRIAEKQGNYPQAEEYLQEGLVLARKLEHGERISALLTALGAVAGGRGAYDQAKAYYQEGLALAQADESSERISLLLANLGVLESDRGAYDEADAYYQKGLALALELGHRERICNLLANLGDLAAQRGAYAQAEAYLQKGLKLAQALGSRTRMSHLLVNLGEVAFSRRAYDQAEAYYEKGLALARQLGHRWLTSGILVEWGELHLVKHSWNLAEDTFRKALQVAQKAGIQPFVARALYGLAQVTFGQGKYASAQQQAEESLAILEKMGNAEAAEVKKWLAEVAFSC